MYQCQILSLNGKSADTQTLIGQKDAVAATLSTSGAQLNSIDAVEAKKLDKEVLRALENGSCDMFLFANALDSTDPSSFRKLFVKTIDSLEAGVKLDEEHKKLKPKLKVSSVGDLGNGYKGYCFSYGGKRFIALPSASLTGKDNAALVREATVKAEDVFRKNAEKYPEGIMLLDEKGNEVDADLNRTINADSLTPPKKQGFFRSFIPMKTDTKKQKVRKIIVLIAIVAFIAALIYVLEFFVFGPMRNRAVTSKIQTVAKGENYVSGEGSDEDVEIDWDALKDINDEIVAWIRIPDTVIDYPVLYHEDDDRYNQYYIKRTYEKEHSEYGSIFIDYRSSEGVKSKNVIMHGHDMNDGSMFAGMLKYSPKGDLKGDLDYYREHPVITFSTPEGGNAKYKIISVYKTSTRYEHGEFFNYMQGDFNSDAEFMNFVYNSRVRSFFNIPVTCNEDDQIISLSTCCYEFYQWRMVIVARKVRPGEDESVNVDLAERNSSPLFPDVYYQRYGGTRPEPLTFKKADAKGEIDWYDGKGNLEGSEDLTATLAANPTDPPTEKPKKGAKPTEPPNIVYYLVTYRNDDGSQFDAFNVKEGEAVPIPEGKPTKPDDEYFTFEFEGWDFDVDGVDFEHMNVGVDIYPKFKAIPKAAE